MIFNEPPKKSNYVNFRKPTIYRLFGVLRGYYMHIKDLPLEARGIVSSRLYFALLKQGKTQEDANKIYHNCNLWTVAQVQLYIDISDVLKGVNYAPKYASR